MASKVTYSQEMEVLRLASLGELSHLAISRRVGISQSSASIVIQRGYARRGTPQPINYSPSEEEIAAEMHAIRLRKHELPAFSCRWLRVVTALMKGK